MRDRIAFAVTKDKLLSVIPDLEISQSLIHDYNISPGRYMYVIVVRNGKLVLERMIWGLIPQSSKEGKNTGNLYKVSKKQVSSKTSYRIPFRSRRCIVLFDHYFVWSNDQAYRISDTHSNLCFAAGVWDEWRNDFERKSSFSILTEPSRGSVVAVAEQIPLFLQQSDFKSWLGNSSAAELIMFLTNPGRVSMSYFETTDRIKDPDYNNIDLLAPVVKSHTLFD